MDESQAIALLKQGDLAGLELLVESYQVKAVYSAYLIVHDQQTAEDIVQTAFIRAFDRISQFDDRRRFGPWFLRTVINAAIDAAKQQDRWLPLESNDEGEAFLPLESYRSGTSWIEDLVDSKEIRTQVRKALNQLSPEQRAAIVMRYFLEMNEAEMAASLRRPPSTIKWWLHKAKEQLQKLLRPFWMTKVDKKPEELQDE